MVAGSSSPLPMPSLKDLARLFFSLSGSRAQWDAAVCFLFLAAGVTGAGMLPGAAAPVTLSARSVCSSASVPALGVVFPRWCCLCDRFGQLT